MGIKATPEIKFAMIREAVSRDNNLLTIRKMCEIAGVSRSGYYNWCAKENARKAQDDTDRKDFEMILEAYRYRGYAKGARGIPAFHNSLFWGIIDSSMDSCVLSTLNRYGRTQNRPPRLRQPVLSL